MSWPKNKKRPVVEIVYRGADIVGVQTKDDVELREVNAPTYVGEAAMRVAQAEAEVAKLRKKLKRAQGRARREVETRKMQEAGRINAEGRAVRRLCEIEQLKERHAEEVAKLVERIVELEHMRAEVLRLLELACSFTPSRGA